MSLRTPTSAPAHRSSGNTQADSKPSLLDYARAEQFMPYNLDPLVLNTPQLVRWLPSGKFWYRTRTHRGLTITFAHPATGHREEIHVQEALSFITVDVEEPDFNLTDLPSDSVSLADDEQAIVIELGAKRWEWPISGAEHRVLPARNAYAVLSPDGAREAFIRDCNLWVRDIATRIETQLTFDGVKDFAYATDNSGRRHTAVPCLRWSPDSKRVATFQQDERGVGQMHLVKTERGHPSVETWTYPMAGDEVIPRIQRVIVDVEKQQVVRLDMPPDLVRSASWLGLAQEPSGGLEAQWSEDGAYVAFVSVSRYHKNACLRIANASTGEVRDVLHENTPTYYESALSLWHALRADEAPNWRCLFDSDELIWYSTRDGWAHLYLYDLRTGRLKRRLTAGAGNVVSVVSIDARARIVYFAAVGREAGRNPYFEHLYRVCFDDGEAELLTPEDAAHTVVMAPSGEYFVDSYSTPAEPPTTVLRASDGRLVQQLERGDISNLTAMGWKPPVSITVKARDGVTELHGLMILPPDFDEDRQYPIINAIYSGPILGSVIATGRHSPQWGAFSSVHGAFGDVHSLASLGFVVVMIDGLGTPLRSRQFHEAGYGDYGDTTLPDQIAAMQELAQRHRWIDLDRVGIYGHSHGGYAAARAMFLYPHFFRVGVASAGNHDPFSYQDEYAEKFIGPCGRSPEFDAQTNLQIAAQLQGRLLLIHGTLDDCVSPNQTLLLVAALMNADKDFDLLMLPNQGHAVDEGAAGRHMVRRCWDYFVRHLLSAEPPAQHPMRRPRRYTGVVRRTSSMGSDIAHRRRSPII